jgi:hypothetical protein
MNVVAIIRIKKTKLVPVHGTIQYQCICCSGEYCNLFDYIHLLIACKVRNIANQK